MSEIELILGPLAIGCIFLGLVILTLFIAAFRRDK